MLIVVQRQPIEVSLIGVIWFKTHSEAKLSVCVTDAPSSQKGHSFENEGFIFFWLFD